MTRSCPAIRFIAGVLLAGAVLLVALGSLAFGNGPPLDELKAIHGPYAPVERGKLLALDGSRSRGKIVTYTWTFGGGNPEARKDGARTSVRLLSDTEVTLTVTDGKKTDSETMPVVVKSRDWKTYFKHVGQTYVGGTRLTADGLVLRFGMNSCVLDPPASGWDWDNPSGDFLHRAHEAATWEKTAYGLEELHDPQGPFDGWWYVGSHALKVVRISLITEDLRQGGAIHQVNKKADRASKKKGCDFETLQRMVRMHERLHSTLLEEALRREGFDPAKKIERLFEQDEETLREGVESEIRGAETQLGEATAEEKVKERLRRVPEFNRPGKVLLLVSGSNDYDTYVIKNFADLSD